MNHQQLLDLLGSVVNFDYHTISQDVEHKEEIKGLVIAVSIELNENHSIAIRDYEDREDSYEISKIKNFKAITIDPYALFENIRNGTI
jgi:hypothetical protein